MELANNLPAIGLSIAGILVTWIYFAFLRKDSRSEKFLSKFKGPPTIPFLGNVHQVLVPSHELIGVFTKWYNEYGGGIRFWLANRPYVILAEAQLVEKILTSSVHIEKSMDYDLLKAWLGTGLLTSMGSKWTSRRKLLTPAFHFKILEDFLEVFNEQSNVLVNILASECADGRKINIFPFITRCALDIISETAMGRKINAQNEKDSDYVRAIYQMGDLFMIRVMRPWLRLDFIWNLTSKGAEEKKMLDILHGFTNKVIREKKVEKRQQDIAKEGKPAENQNSKDEDLFLTKKRRLAFLDLLLEVAEDGKVLSDSDIREETDTFMFEGHDTTAANLSWTLFLLAANPECQEKVVEELDGIFGGERDKELTAGDLTQMKYLELCIKESLRMFPSVPFFARKIRKDLVLDDDRTVPAGSQALIVPYLLHRDESVFPDPEVFRPERFLNENKRHPYAYVPFSAGPRNCIGQKFAIMEEKVVLAKVLVNYTLEAAENVKDIKMVPDLILRPMNGLHIKLRRRPQ